MALNGRVLVNYAVMHNQSARPKAIWLAKINKSTRPSARVRFLPGACISDLYPLRPQPQQRRTPARQLGPAALSLRADQRARVPMALAPKTHFKSVFRVCVRACSRALTNSSAADADARLRMSAHEALTQAENSIMRSVQMHERAHLNIDRCRNECAHRHPFGPETKWMRSPSPCVCPAQSLIA